MVQADQTSRIDKTLSQKTWRWRHFLLLMVGLLIWPYQSPAADVSQGAAQSQAHEQERGGQEHFLQHFISRSLVPEAASTGDTPPQHETQPMASPPAPRPSPSVPQPLGESPSNDLAGAALKMILALVVILTILVGAAYVLKRYGFPHVAQGQNGQELQVVAKVPVTAKTMVALVKVPGKSLVLGISGTTITALSEIPDAVDEKQAEPAVDLAAEDEVEDYKDKQEESVSETVSESFASSLERYQNGQANPEEDGHQLLTVQEAIQKKVNGLKQL